MSLYNKYRPRSLKQMYGCKKAKAILRGYTAETLPHTLLFKGPTGCGKTTLARIVGRGLLRVGDQDLNESNGADFTGVDYIRSIIDTAKLHPWGDRRFDLLDECHMLSKQAQEALLKHAEEPPPTSYMALCTTEPNSLKPTLRNRCVVIEVQLLNGPEAADLVAMVCEKEGLLLEDDVVEAVVESGEGCARQLLSSIETIMHMKDPAEQLAALQTPFHAQGVFDLWRALMGKKWQAAAAVLKTLEEEPERVRWALLTMTTNAMLKTTAAATDRHYRIIVSMSEPFYNTKKAGLAAACFEACK